MRAVSGHKFEKFLRLAIWVAAALAFVSCTNNLSRSVSSSGVNGPGTGNGGNLDTGSAAPIMTITNVLKDNQSPTTTLDVLGDGSNAMAQLCIAASGSGLPGPSPSPSVSPPPSGAGVGTSTCTCTYSYTSPSVGSQQIEVNTSYFESNLIQCGYTQIPSDVTSVTVKVHVTTQNAYSNSVTINISGIAGSSPTSASSYTQVTRYQCRDIVSIPYPFSPQLGTPNSMYDPVQSEDPSFNYPLNFYSTNFGGSLASYILNNVKNWNCPSNPSDPNFGTNYNLYSVGADAGGSKQIYPPTGSAFDRSTFYVANAPAGVFSIPLNAYIAPTLVSGSPPVGYAAAPIPSGANQETCPDTVPIPTGFHWVKVWLFRADLPDRRYTVSPATAQLKTVGCNPGLYSDGTVVFPNCNTNEVTVRGAVPVKGGYGFANLSTPPPLLDRILAGETDGVNQMCVGITPTITLNPGNYGFGPGATDASSTTQNPVYVQLGLGTDIWQPRGGVGTGDPYTQPLIDPMDLNGPTFTFVPKDLHPQTQDLDLGNPRYDFVYIVTPESVMAAQMENSSNTSNYPYIPYRFPNASDCLSPDPDNPLTPGDCNPSKIIHYGLKLHDVASNGDPPANNPNRPGVFPMCALQPN